MEYTPRFVWVSTRESVASGRVSVLACVEVVFAVALYWYVAIRFHTQVHLWVSILIAPLLLLRSKASVKRGIRWFKSYTDQDFSTPEQVPNRLLTSAAFYGTLVLACVIMGYTAYCLSLTFGDRFGPLAAVLTYSAVGYLATQIALALLVTFWVREVAALMERRFEMIVAGTILAISVVIGVSWVRVAWIEIIVAAAIPVILTTIGAFQAPAAIREARRRARLETHAQSQSWFFLRAVREAAGMSYTFFLMGFFLGAWLQSLLIRFRATLRHPIEGFRALPDNWWRSLFVIDFMHPPEVIPGYDRKDPFNPAHYLSRLRSTGSTVKKYEDAVALTILFIPAYLYRLSIKSTCWVYLPWIYLARPPRLSITPGYLADLVEDSLRERFRRFLACLTLLTLVASLIPQVAMALARTSVTVLSPLEYLFLINFWAIKPWQWFNLVSALITLILVFLVSDLKITIKHAGKDRYLNAMMKQRAFWIERAMLARRISTFALTLIVLGHALLWLSPIQTYLPKEILTSLQEFYGSAFPEQRSIHQQLLIPFK